MTHVDALDERLSNPVQNQQHLMHAL